MKKGILVVIILVAAIVVIRLCYIPTTLQASNSQDSKLPRDSTWMNAIKPGDELLSILIAANNFVYGYEHQDIKNGLRFDYGTVGSYLREKKTFLDSNKLVVIQASAFHNVQKHGCYA